MVVPVETECGVDGRVLVAGEKREKVVATEFGEEGDGVVEGKGWG